MQYDEGMHRTTVSLPDHLYLRVRNLASRSDRPVGQVVAELLAEALAARSAAFASHASGDADVDDLGVNAEKYLREALS